MKIITVNLPVSYIKAMDALVGNKKMYPSRSELIRVSTREFLIRELDAVKSFGQNASNPPTPPTMPNVDPEMYVQVPLNTNPEVVGPAYKTFRIIKK
jgi:hypothetical protein